MVVVRILIFGVGLVVEIWLLLSVLRTVVLPRGEQVALTRAVFDAMRWLFGLRVRRTATFAGRDRILALLAPLTLVVLPVVWVIVTAATFTLMFWALDVDTWRRAGALSLSSLTTLGFVAADDLPTTALAAGEAVIGLGLVALLISYLPSIYSSFQRRELEVNLLEVRAGNPPSAETLIVRHHRIGWLERSDTLFHDWERWFADIEETHTSQPALAFFRSPLPGRSWVTAAGALLDAAALMLSAVDGPPVPQAQLCLRAGYLSLRRIADGFDIAYDVAPRPDDPISVSRDEWDEAVGRLATAGVPIRADLDQAWRDFHGWRVNYDVVLLALADLVMAPPAPWSSDRTNRHISP